ncbi:MAG: sulfatase [Pseudomonadota bacterium]
MKIAMSALSASLLLLVVACSAQQSESAQGAVESDQEDIVLETAEDIARPNIVLVLFEDMSPRVGSFGDPLAVTPNWDRIASEGIKYTNVFTTSGVCAPSRAALITGHYQQTIGAQHMRTTGASGLPGGGPQNYLAVPGPEVKAFPELLRSAGYYTSNDSKTDYQFGEPFTIWDQSGEEADWSGRSDDQPFFHMQTLFDTHESATWPIDMAVTNPIEAFIVQRNTTVFADRAERVAPEEVTVPPYLPDTQDVRRDIATHYNNIAFTDMALGELYDRLEAEGLLDETILIISTDHGDGLPRMKRSLYDSGLNVPMVIRYPDRRGAGTQNEELISFIDLAPIILSWAETEAPQGLHGLDLIGVDREPERQYVFAAQDRMDGEMNHQRAVRDERFKYIRNYIEGDPFFEPLAFRDSQPSMQALWAGRDAGTLPPAAAALFEPLPEEQLYDTDTDPHEVNNLADDPAYQADLLRLRGALSDWMDEVGDMSSLPEADMIETMWPGGEQPMTQAVNGDISSLESGYKVVLTSPTEGASIGYKFDEGAEHWQLYNGPLIVEAGSVLTAKAVRYGYAESAETTVNVPE